MVRLVAFGFLQRFVFLPAASEADFQLPNQLVGHAVQNKAVDQQCVGADKLFPVKDFGNCRGLAKNIEMANSRDDLHGCDGRLVFRSITRPDEKRSIVLARLFFALFGDHRLILVLIWKLQFGPVFPPFYGVPVFERVILVTILLHGISDLAGVIRCKDQDFAFVCDSIYVFDLLI